MRYAAKNVTTKKEKRKNSIPIPIINICFLKSISAFRYLRTSKINIQIIANAPKKTLEKRNKNPSNINASQFVILNPLKFAGVGDKMIIGAISIKKILLSNKDTSPFSKKT